MSSLGLVDENLASGFEVISNAPTSATSGGGVGSSAATAGATSPVGGASETPEDAPVQTFGAASSAVVAEDDGEEVEVDLVDNAAPAANPGGGFGGLFSHLRIGLKAVSNAAKTAVASMHHEVSNENSDLRAVILPALHAHTVAAATAVSAAAHAVVNEVSNPASDFRSKIIPGAVANAGLVAHEISDPQSRFRTEYVAPAAASATIAATTVAHEVCDQNSTFRTAYIAPTVAAASAAATTVHHEVTDPESKLRSHVLPSVAAAGSAAVTSISHELRDSNSTFRTGYVAPVVAAGAAVVNEVTNSSSVLRTHIIPGVIHEVVDPHSNLRAKTVETVAGAVATGVTVGGHVTKAALVVSGDMIGKGVRTVTSAASNALGAPGPATHISAATSANLEAASSAVATAVAVSGIVVAGASAMAAGLGASASAAIRSTQAGEYLESTPAGRTLVAAGTATAAAVGEVWSGAVEGVSRLSGHTSEATADFVGARYGAEARVAAEKSAAIVHEAGKVVANAVLLTPVALVGQAAGAAVQTTAAQEDLPVTLPPPVHDTSVE